MCNGDESLLQLLTLFYVSHVLDCSYKFMNLSMKQLVMAVGGCISYHMSCYLIALLTISNFLFHIRLAVHQIHCGILVRLFDYSFYGLSGLHSPTR